MARKFIPAYYDWLESLSACTDAEMGLLLRAMLSYGRDGVTPSFPSGSRLELVWGLLRSQVDGSIDTYNKRSAAGKKGGSTRWEQPAVTAEEVQETKEFLDGLRKKTK